MPHGILAKKDALRRAIIASTLLASAHALAEIESQTSLPLSAQLPNIDAQNYAGANFQAQRSALGYSSALPAVTLVGQEIELPMQAKAMHPDQGAASIPRRTSTAAVPRASRKTKKTKKTKKTSHQALNSYVNVDGSYSSGVSFGRPSSDDTVTRLKPRSRTYALPETTERQRLASNPAQWPHITLSSNNYSRILKIEDGRTLAGPGDRVTIDMITAPVGSKIRGYHIIDGSLLARPTSEMKVLRSGANGVAVLERGVFETQVDDFVLSQEQIAGLTQGHQSTETRMSTHAQPVSYALAQPLMQAQNYAPNQMISGYPVEISSTPMAVQDINASHLAGISDIQTGSANQYGLAAQQNSAYSSYSETPFNPQSTGLGRASASVVETPGSTIGAAPNGLVYIDNNNFRVGEVVEFTDTAANSYAYPAISQIEIVSIDGQHSVGRVLKSTRPVETGFTLVQP